MKLLIANGYVIDPAQQINAGRNVLIEDERIVGLLDRSEPAPEDAHVIDATGLVVAPGFIDLHTHLREPGQEYKETVRDRRRRGGRRWLVQHLRDAQHRSDQRQSRRHSFHHRPGKGSQARQRFSDRRCYEGKRRQRARRNGRDEKRRHRGRFRRRPTGADFRNDAARDGIRTRFRSHGRRPLPGSFVERGRRDARGTLVADSRPQRNAGGGGRCRRRARLRAWPN